MSAPSVDAVELFAPGGRWHGLDFSALRSAGLLVKDKSHPWMWIDPLTGSRYTISGVQGAQLQARYGEEAARRTPAVGKNAGARA